MSKEQLKVTFSINITAFERDGEDREMRLMTKNKIWMLDSHTAFEASAMGGKPHLQTMREKSLLLILQHCSIRDSMSRSKEGEEERENIACMSDCTVNTIVGVGTHFIVDVLVTVMDEEIGRMMKGFPCN